MAIEGGTYVSNSLIEHRMLVSTDHWLQISDQTSKDRGPEVGLLVTSLLEKVDISSSHVKFAQG